MVKDGSKNTNITHTSKLSSRAACIQGNSNFSSAKKASAQYNNKIQALEEEIELLTSYASDTVYRLHYGTMKYDYISSAVTNLLGFAVDEMKKINFRSLILETKIVTNGLKTVKSFDELEKKRELGDVNKWQADYLIRTKDGRKIWVSDVSYPWFDESGKIIGSTGSLRDITQRVETEAALRQEFEGFAHCDALTALYNRRSFFDEFERELKRIRRNGEELSLLVIDIDHLRDISEEYGKDIADKILIEVATIIKSTIRDIDLAGRLGGGEFSALLIDTLAPEAFAIGERIRNNILQHQFNLGTDNAPLGCSVSIGTATANSIEDAKSSDLYKTANTRLFIAKNTGHNQVSVDEIMVTH